ncbi:MAG: AMP-binding protein [Bryobacterales bacterium]|nr:AMP-binding protein [Bryobacterales bacterium]
MRDRRAIEAAQWERLQTLRQALLGQNKFCSERLDTGFASLAEFRARTPFTTKAELVEDQLAHPPFGSNLTYPVERYTRFCQTSGTTGVPLRWLDTEESWDWMAHCWCRVFQSANTTAADRIFFAFSFGPFLGFWTAFDGAKKIGALAIPGGGMSSTARLRTIFDARATILCCTPTYAIRLGETASEEGFDLRQSAIRAVILAGEAGASVSGTRALIEQLWPGARIVDHHGMTETGPVSYECPRRAGVLHILEDEYIAEIVDPETGDPLEDGQKGELVLTNLGRIAAPVIRYRTGDIVQPSPRGQCACGSHELALEGGILARRDDMVVIRGVNVYPSAIEDVIRHCGGVAEYRVEIQTVRAMVELRLSVEPAPDAGAHLAHRLEAALRDALGLRIPIHILGPDSLPRFEMKSRRWVHVKP